MLDQMVDQCLAKKQYINEYVNTYLTKCDKGLAPCEAGERSSLPAEQMSWVLDRGQPVQRPRGKTGLVMF
jgi:hypothetical protein